jgi:DNA-binding IclR family transcriptional regulator
MNNPVGDLPRYPIDSVDNALQLLLLFTEQASIGVSAASERLGVAPSTAHRLLKMLVYRGFVEQNDARSFYTVGPSMLLLARTVLQGGGLRGVARPFIEELVRETNETVHLATVHQTDVLYVDCVEGSRPIRSGSRIGDSLPAHATAAGKAVLATLPADRVAKLYRGYRFTRLTGDTIRSLTALNKDLAAVRERGFATNLGESESYLHAVAAAVLTDTAPTEAAITLAAPAHRLSNDEIGPVGELVAQTAARISEALI